MKEIAILIGIIVAVISFILYGIIADMQNQALQQATNAILNTTKSSLPANSPTAQIIDNTQASINLAFLAVEIVGVFGIIAFVIGLIHKAGF